MKSQTVFSKRLIETRNDRGYTQKALAELVGVQPNTVYKWEKNMIIPSIEAVKKLAATLETTTSYLLGESNHGDKTSGHPSVLRDIPLTTLPVLDIYAERPKGTGFPSFSGSAKKTGERVVETRIVGEVSPLEDKQPFIVTVRGNGMSDAGLQNGTEAVINPAEDIRNGDAALVCHGHDGDIEIKWVYFKPEGAVELRSATPGFPIYEYTKEEQKNPENPLTLIGKVMAFSGFPRRGL